MRFHQYALGEFSQEYFKFLKQAEIINQYVIQPPLRQTGNVRQELKRQHGVIEQTLHFLLSVINNCYIRKANILFQPQVLMQEPAHEKRFWHLGCTVCSFIRPNAVSLGLTIWLFVFILWSLSSEPCVQIAQNILLLAPLALLSDLQPPPIGLCEGKLR